MKSILKLALLLLLPCFTEAQSLEKKIDSLKKLIAASKEDTTKANLLNKIGNIYISSNKDTALLLYEQSLDLYRKEAFSTGEVKELLGEAMDIAVQTNAVEGTIDNVEQFDIIRARAGGYSDWY